MIIAIDADISAIVDVCSLAWPFRTLRESARLEECAEPTEGACPKRQGTVFSKRFVKKCQRNAEKCVGSQ